MRSRKDALWILEDGEHTVSDIHDRPPGAVTPLAIAAGAAVRLPSLTAPALAIVAVGATLF